MSTLHGSQPWRCWNSMLLQVLDFLWWECYGLTTDWGSNNWDLHDQPLEYSDALALSFIHSLAKQTYEGLGVFRGLSRVPTTWLSSEQHLDPADPERPILSEWLGKWQASLSNLESKPGFDKRMGLSWVSQVGETGTLLAPWVEVAFGYCAFTAIPCHLYTLRFCCVHYNSIVMGASRRYKFRGWQGMFPFSII